MRAQYRRGGSRLMATTGAVLAVVILAATSAAAGHASVEISIPLDTVVRAPTGSITELGTAPVPDGFADHSCEVRAHAENQQSIHPGNDLVISSGDSQVRLENVESEPGQVIDTEEMLVLGEVITVSLVMGPDGVFSAGLEVIVECVAEDTTTTSEVPTTDESTTTTSEVSPTDETTTTAPVSTTEQSPSTTTDEGPTSTSIEDEVKGTEVLPFTGLDASETGLLALALLAGGTLLLVGARRREE